MTSENCGERDYYKEEFKRYKKRGTDYKSIIDFKHLESFSSEISKIPCAGSLPSSVQEVLTSTATRLGLRPPHEWTMYALKSVPGLIVIPNPFISGGQHRWVRQCLVTYPCKPNVCNLDAHMERKGDGRLWPVHTTRDAKCVSHESLRSGTEDLESTDSNPCANIDGDSQHKDSDMTAGSTPKKMKLSSKIRSKQSKLPMNEVSLQPCFDIAKLKSSMLYKLRWVTLGYHYNWTTKEYSSSNRSIFPSDLAELSSFILENAGFPGFIAEAAIVNYYHLDSSLSGHTDHSEKDLSRPLLSISFGQSAIFLIGGKTKQVKPTPLFLASGDIVIMSTDSRLSYHGVPRILSPGELDDANLVPLCLRRETLEQTVQHDEQSCVCKERTQICRKNSVKQECNAPVECTFCKCIIQERTQIGEMTATSEMPTTECKGFESCCGSIERICSSCLDSWSDFETYLSVSRINVNVRQVVSEECTF